MKHRPTGIRLSRFRRCVLKDTLEDLIRLYPAVKAHQLAHAVGLSRVTLRALLKERGLHTTRGRIRTKMPAGTTLGVRKYRRRERDQRE